MELKGEYRENESPLERLRNKLTPFFTAVSIVAMEDVLKESPVKDMVQNSANTAHGYQGDIKTYLADIETLLGRLEELSEKEYRRRLRFMKEHGLDPDEDDVDWAEEEFLEGMDEDEEEEEEEGGTYSNMKPPSPGSDANGN